MLDDTEDSVDLWRQVASAVEYIAELEHPGFTVWDALEEAITLWMTDELGECRKRVGEWIDQDPLRTALGDLIARSSPAGVVLADALISALAAWLAIKTADLNRGQRFRFVTCH